MSWLEKEKFFKDRVTRTFSAVRIPKIEGSLRELIYAGIQVAGGAALASYTYGNGTYGILPYMSAGIAVGGTYNFFKTMRKNSQKSFFRTYRVWSKWDLASGIFTYSTGVYAFSESFKRNDRMWIVCLTVAASGYYLTSSSINSLDRALNRKPFLKCCQLMFEPTLFACSATYLFYFRNHQEGWLKCLPFLVTGVTGFRLVDRSCLRIASLEDPELLLLKVIEMFMGGCFLGISSIALAVYSFSNDFYWPLTVFLGVVSLYSCFVTLGSLTCLRCYVDMETRVFFPTVGMIAGPMIFSSAFLLVECVEKNDMLYLAFLFLIQAGQCISYVSFYQLSDSVSQQVFFRYCQRVLGPFLAVYSSVVSVYVIYRLGWQFSLMTMPFVTAGIYATYRGFRKDGTSVV